MYLNIQILTHTVIEVLCLNTFNWINILLSRVFVFTCSDNMYEYYFFAKDPVIANCQLIIINELNILFELL